jgi:hypothetical protein
MTSRGLSSGLIYRPDADRVGDTGQGLNRNLEQMGLGRGILGDAIGAVAGEDCNGEDLLHGVWPLILGNVVKARTIIGALPGLERQPVCG